MHGAQQTACQPHAAQNCAAQLPAMLTPTLYVSTTSIPHLMERDLNSVFWRSMDKEKKE
jgi:hypothetical protein